MSETGISPLLLLIVINCDGRGWGVPREGALQDTMEMQLGLGLGSCFPKEHREG